MSGPDFPLRPRRARSHFPQKVQVRRHRSKPNFRLAPFMAVAFFATLAILQREPAARSLQIATPALKADAAVGPDTLSAHFGFCHTGGGRDCVVDGDTFWFAGEKYRIADIDTPETHPARCAEEAALGEAATDRLRVWLNAGAFSLEGVDRDTDRYDRKLRIVTRGGASVGDELVAEGLARRWEGYRRPWC